MGIGIARAGEVLGLWECLGSGSAKDARGLMLGRAKAAGVVEQWEG